MKTKKSTGNVFADLGFHGEQAENLRIRAMLMAEAEQFIKRKGLSQAQAAARMGVSQPRISDLVRGKIGVFSVDSLIAMLSAVGLKVSVRVLKNKAA
jgi:predicted XRE-type DNA-binding protein